MLAVGDSITDDLRSWTEILRHLLELRRADDGIRVVNGGLSAHTTAMVLRRWPATLQLRPGPTRVMSFPPSPQRIQSARVAAFPPFRMGESTWRNADLVELADAVRAFDDPVVERLVSLSQ